MEIVENETQGENQALQTEQGATVVAQEETKKGKAAVAAKEKKQKATALLDTEKTEIVAKFGKTKTDTGSPSVQIALLTKRINQLTRHLMEHKQDKHSHRGLMKMVGKRRRLLNYLEKSNLEEFRSLKKELELR